MAKEKAAAVAKAEAEAKAKADQDSQDNNSTAAKSDEDDDKQPDYCSDEDKSGLSPWQKAICNAKKGAPKNDFVKQTKTIFKSKKVEKGKIEKVIDQETAEGKTKKNEKEQTQETNRENSDKRK